MKVLTDTHSLVWALASPEFLSKRALKVLSESDVVVSVANLWELILKVNKRDALLNDPVAWWDRHIERPNIPVLSIRTVHVMALARLPDLHKDPFDRILVAQAVAEDLPLVSKDADLKRYGVTVIW